MQQTRPRTKINIVLFPNNLIIIQPGAAITKRDVLFLIDESGSVGSENYEKFKRLAQAFTNSKSTLEFISISNSKYIVSSDNKAKSQFKYFHDPSTNLAKTC